MYPSGAYIALQHGEFVHVGTPCFASSRVDKASCFGTKSYHTESLERLNCAAEIFLCYV